MSSERVMEFSVASNAHTEQPLPQTAPDGEVKFFGPKDVSITSTHPLLTAALVCLNDRWPAPLGFETLWEMAQRQLAVWGSTDSALPEHRAALAKALLNCYGSGLVKLHSWAPPLTAEPGYYPTASPLARLQSLNGNVVTTLLHTSVELSDSLAKTLLQLLDGTRDRPAIVKWLVEAVVSGRASLMVAEKECHDPAVIEQTISTELESHLKNLARLGLLCREGNQAPREFNDPPPGKKDKNNAY
jgi:hypothetical protein